MQVSESSLAVHHNRLGSATVIKKRFVTAGSGCLVEFVAEQYSLSLMVETRGGIFHNKTLTSTRGKCETYWVHETGDLLFSLSRKIRVHVVASLLYRSSAKDICVCSYSKS